jgi:hypothetical protein
MARIYCKLCGATNYRAEGATVRKCTLTADDGELQQSRHVQAGGATKQSALDRIGAHHQLVLERGRDRADLAVVRRHHL